MNAVQPAQSARPVATEPRPATTAAATPVTGAELRANEAYLRYDSGICPRHHSSDAHARECLSLPLTAISIDGGPAETHYIAPSETS